MDLTSLLRTLARHWAVTLTMLLVTGVTAWRVAEQIEPEYSAKAAVLLLAPTTDASNPYTDSSRGLADTATAMALVMNGPNVQRDMKALFPDVRFSVEAGEDSGILGIEVIGPEADDVLLAQDAYLAELHGQVLDRQREAGVAEELLVRDTVLTASLGASARYGARDRALAAVLLLGLLATVAAAALAESAASRRIERRRRAALRVTTSAAAGTEVPAIDQQIDDVLEKL
jgi:hypothetical protein